MIPKINSSHGSETRNIINAAIDSINTQGKTIQDLVARGQLTPAQYSQLIQTVNNMISKGNVTVHDIDKNLGKFDASYFSSDFLEELNKGNITATKILPGSVTNQGIAEKSVTPSKTTFFEKTENLFSGNYEIGVLGWENIEGEPYDRDDLFLVDSYRDNRGMVTIFEVEANQEYSIKVFGDHNQFRLATYRDYPEIPKSPERNYASRKVVDNSSISEYTFENNSTDSYCVLYVSSIGQAPKVNIVKGKVIDEYLPTHTLRADYLKIDDYMQDRNTSVIETSDGYPTRPNALSVTWIGPNEPVEVEPYDEWRETVGYTYFTDFSDYAPGINMMSDWSKPWITNFNTEIIQGTKSNVLSFIANQDLLGPKLLSWNKIDDNYNENVEVYTKIRTPSVASQVGSIILRGSKGETDFSGYVIGPRGISNLLGHSTFRISKYINGSTHVLREFDVAINTNDYFNMVARIEDDVISIKVWQNSKEPKDWELTLIDNTFLDSGYTGIYHYHPNTSLFVDEFSVGTGGMRAPRRKLI